MIAENIRMVQGRIDTARKTSGRQPGEVSLIAVSKTKPVSMLKEAYAAGIRDFGENRAQELVEKYGQLPGDVRWHMIGHLQRNKVKSLIGKTALIHSVDSLALAEEISRQSVRQSLITEILIEVNAAGEESKFGVPPKEALSLVRQIAALDGVRIRGLMTVAPLTANPEENRKYFRLLKELSVDIAAKNVDNVYMDILSMGMTNDYEAAIAEGATCVRVGTGIFGARSIDE